MGQLTKEIIDELSYEIIGCAIEVHRQIGPGLLESVYEKCMIHELKTQGFEVVSQQKVPLVYKGISLDAELRYDLLIEDAIIVELKGYCRSSTDS